MTKPARKRPTDATHLGNSFSPDLLGRRNLTIFSVDVHWRPSIQPLPSITVSEETALSKAIEDTEDLYNTPHGGRFPMMLFPDESPEPVSVTARTFADSYYYEGLCTSANKNLGKRIDCFRTAELLYLHAAMRGDVRAHVTLGYTYLYDRCHGHYFDALRGNLLADRTLPPEQIAQKSYEHFSYGAEMGEPEATYMLGDLLRDGYGCDIDLDEAYQCYRRAYQIIDDTKISSHTLRGCIELRLARALEEGEGCTYDHEASLALYEKATASLEKIVDQGSLYYGIEFGEAKRGLLRVQQELALQSL